MAQRTEREVVNQYMKTIVLNLAAKSKEAADRGALGHAQELGDLAHTLSEVAINLQSLTKGE